MGSLEYTQGDCTDGHMAEERKSLSYLFLKKMTPCVFRSFCCDHVDLIFTPFYLDNLAVLLYS